MNPRNEQTDLKLPMPSYSENLSAVRKEEQPVAPAAHQVPVMNNDMLAPPNQALGVDHGSVALTAASTTNQNSVASDAAVPVDAANEDTLGESWTQKIKETIKLTASDPHQQAENLYSLKSQYLKLRFDKELKKTDS